VELVPLRLLARTPRDEAQRLQRQEGRYVGLLLTALVPMLLLPLTASPDRGSLVLLAGVFSLLILQSLRTLARPVSGPRARLRCGAYRLLGLLSLVSIWIPPLKGSWLPLSLKLTGLTLLSLFFLVTSVRLVQRLARAPRVNARVMAGASAGYLLLGISGGVIATATDLYVPGSFHLAQVTDQELLLDRLTYFSFVTIAGLGPGDIVAANAVGERFVMLLSVSSTLYVALLVGLLLGRFIASQEVAYLEEDLRAEERRRRGEGETPEGSSALHPRHRR
jgi:voltage-gated potassium channel